jgi:hypothetical protein
MLWTVVGSLGVVNFMAEVFQNENRDAILANQITPFFVKLTPLQKFFQNFFQIKAKPNGTQKKSKLAVSFEFEQCT